MANGKILTHYKIIKLIWNSWNSTWTWDFMKWIYFAFLQWKCNSLGTKNILTATLMECLSILSGTKRMLQLLLLSRFSRVRLFATPQTAAHQVPPSLGFSRQEHWSGLPFPSPMHESEMWKWSRTFVSDSSRLHGLQPTRLLHPWDFPGESTGVGRHCLVQQRG